jgi:hypothetical protein
MKTRNAFLAALGTATILVAQPAVTSELTAQMPDTAAARSAAGLMARAERAFKRYAAACAARDSRAARDATTTDVRIEFTLGDPGVYLSLDASSLLSVCGPEDAAFGVGTRVSNLWILPTGDANAVFVQYDARAGANGPPQRQLALLELEGGRIARLRNFGGLPPGVLTALLRTETPRLACVRSSVRAGLADNSGGAP